MRPSAPDVFAPGHLGELTQVVPFEMVDAALEAGGGVQRRVRRLPSRVVVHLLLAGALFGSVGWSGVWSRLCAGPGRPVEPVSASSMSLSMFLCKRVRSEMGVDSVGVGGGEPGGPAGGALRLVVTCPSTSLPLALREWAGVFFSLARSAARRSSMLQIAGHSSLTAASSEGKWPRLSADRAARWFSDSIALVVQR